MKDTLYKQEIKLAVLQLVGITVRTNNKNEFDPTTAKIGTLVQTYFGQQIAANFKHRVTPGTTYAVYTDYDTDEHGDYTYFIGEIVSSFAEQDQVLYQQVEIPASRYQKFTTDPGAFPTVVINAWQQIWQMTAVDFEGRRTYKADFELYDQRAADPNHAVVDIYIGIL